MKIAFINNNAGDATFLAKELARKGHDTHVFVFDTSKYKRWGGTMIKFRALVRESNGHTTINPLWFITRYNFFKRLESYGIWHYQYPYGTLNREVLRHIKDQILVKHYEGSDIRGKFDNESCIVSTPDLLAYAPNGVWIKSPIDIEYISQFKKKELTQNKIPLVAHYPYYLNSPLRAIDKEIYIPSLASLEKKGKCKVTRIIGRSHEETLKALAVCDIVIGKIMTDAGWFGKFEVEGMALGKPVIAYVSDNLFDKYKPPIYNTSKETFEQDLEALIENNKEQKRLAHEGHEYATTHHNVRYIAEQVEQYYNKLM